jgi:hypothetical protein
MMRKIILLLLLPHFFSCFAAPNADVFIELVYFKTKGGQVTPFPLCAGTLTYTETKDNQEKNFNKVIECINVGSPPVNITLYASSGSFNNGKIFNIKGMYDSDESYELASITKKPTFDHIMRMEVRAPDKWAKNVIYKSLHWVKISAKFSNSQHKSSETYA